MKMALFCDRGLDKELDDCGVVDVFVLVEQSYSKKMSLLRVLHTGSTLLLLSEAAISRLRHTTHKS